MWSLFGAAHTSENTVFLILFMAAVKDWAQEQPQISLRLCHQLHLCLFMKVHVRKIIWSAECWRHQKLSAREKAVCELVCVVLLFGFGMRQIAVTVAVSLTRWLWSFDSGLFNVTRGQCRFLDFTSYSSVGGMCLFEYAHFYCLSFLVHWYT